MNRILSDTWRDGKQRLKQLVASSSRVTICLDGWSKKGLTAAFLGISACLFDAESGEVRHITLGLQQLNHPHTGEQLAAALTECLSDWSVAPEKILLVVTDNGANVVKAVRLLREANTACELEVEDEDDVSGDNDEDEENSETEEDDDEVTRDVDVEAEQTTHK